MSTFYGRLIYLCYAKHDIAYAVSVISQFMNSLSERNMNAFNQICDTRRVL